MKAIKIIRNAFVYNWPITCVVMIIVGIPVLLITHNRWQLIPVFLGSFSFDCYKEYKIFNNRKSNFQTTKTK